MDTFEPFQGEDRDMGGMVWGGGMSMASVVSLLLGTGQIDALLLERRYLGWVWGVLTIFEK
jgi:hypothetical protein